MLIECTWKVLYMLIECIWKVLNSLLEMGLNSAELYGSGSPSPHTPQFIRHKQKLKVQ